jgi:pyrroloquinoline-quinone synthase
MALPPADFLAQLEADRHRQTAYMDHPLYGALLRGELDREQLKTWAVQHYQTTKVFPRLVGLIHAQCPVQSVRTLLAENIYEEDTGRLSRTAPHTVLYHRFANAIGITSADLEAAEPLVELKTMMEWFAGLIARSDWVVGACAFLHGLESQKPGSRERRLQALRETYRIPEDALTFFIIHIGLDDEHGDVGARIVAEFAVTDELQRACRTAFNQSVRLQGLASEAIARACGVLQPA